MKNKLNWVWVGLLAVQTSWAEPMSSMDSVLSSQMTSSSATVAALEVNAIRTEMIRDTAATYATQESLASSLEAFNQSALKRKSIYDRSYNFSPVMLEPGFLPPVISEGRDSYNQTGESTVRAADLTFRIEFDARIVNTPPRWEEYLITSVARPEKPNAAVLPKTSEENKLWDEWAKKGWAQGQQQAANMFDANLARLNRDFLGMWRYKKLYNQGLVSKPILARTTLGVTGGGKEMSVNDRIVQITDTAKFNPDTSRWLYPQPQ